MIRDMGIWLKLFQSTHPLRGATCVSVDTVPGADISIHAPLAGCDALEYKDTRPNLAFQSTHPLRGATTDDAISPEDHLFQSTHPLRGAT